jgi:D-alanine-D-alanine ligase
MHANLPKETIAVLFGGRSAEHEVSVITGHQVLDALEAAGYTVLPIYITKRGAWYAGRPLYNIDLYANPALNLDKLQDVYRVSLSPDRTVRQLLPHADSGRRLFQRLPRLWADVFFPTLHGNFGEDGALQGLFEMADVAYVGSGIFASAIGMDKVRMKSLCRDMDIPVLDCVSMRRDEWQDDRLAWVEKVEAFSAYPVLVKPVCLGSSIGVRRCDDREVLEQAIDVAMMLDDRVLVEPALTDFFEINCAVMGPPTQVSVCEQPHTVEALLSFDAKYKQGGKGAKGGGAKGGMASLGRTVPADIPDVLASQIKAFAGHAFHAIGATGVARIDFLIESARERVYFNEINTLPGSLAFYLWEADGVPFDELVTRAVDIALDQHRIRRATQFVFDANLLRNR